MSQGDSPVEKKSSVNHLNIKTNDDLLTSGALNKVRKLEVKSCDETFYPVVSIKHSTKIEVNSVLSEKKEIETKNTPLIESVNKMEEKESKRGRWKIWRSRLASCLVGGIALLAVVLVGMRLAGFRTFTVMSGSMEPGLPVGSLIYVKPVDYKSLKVGDVVSYVANDDKVVVTHRIVDIEKDVNDPSVVRFRTQGDANDAADANLVHYKNVLGTPMIVLPKIGYFAYNIQQPPGIYITLVVGTLLLAWTFLPGTLEERRKTARKSVAN